jgi:hypothetical protein
VTSPLAGAKSDGAETIHVNTADSKSVDNRPVRRAGAERSQFELFVRPWTTPMTPQIPGPSITRRIRQFSEMIWCVSVLPIGAPSGLIPRLQLRRSADRRCRECVFQNPCVPSADVRYFKTARGLSR